jgi:hypothetical protein
LSRLQRLAGWLTCLTVAICSVGVPMPARSERKAGDTPFPCQDCPCGCKDAETCWRDCCCFTNQQKVAWARKHRVAIPAFVVVAAKREGCDGQCERACCEAKTASVKLAVKKPACCARREAACVSCTVKSVAARTCSRCDEQSACDDATPATEQRRSSSPVLLISKLRCGGISLSVSMMPASVVVKATDFCWDLDERFEPFVLSANLYEPPYLAVAAPPPDTLA